MTRNGKPAFVHTHKFQPNTGIASPQRYRIHPKDYAKSTWQGYRPCPPAGFPARPARINGKSPIIQPLYLMEHLASGVSINSKDETIIKERINEELLCVLRENKLTNQIEVDYVKIENPFSAITDNLDNLCDNPNSTLQQILNFIKATAKLNHLTDHYRYCVYLHGTYQAFSANNQDTITEITEIINESQLRLLNKENNYEIEKAIAEYTAKLKKKYVLWSKAYSINKTYRFCQQDKSILTFSHRITGWSNPVYQLTPDFSVEIKTNFGFG